MLLLGIDQGTTGTRACLVDVERELAIVDAAYAPHAQLTPRPGWVEHDPAEIWACTQRVIGQVLASGRTPAGVAIANQGETVMIWDARTGEPLHRALVWQDTRTEPQIAALAHQPGANALVADATGLRLDAYFSASKLRWLLDEVPGARSLAAAGHLRAGTLDTWLVERLTGGAVFATDASTAARTLLCETRGSTWSVALRELFDIPANVLPEIRNTDAGFGTCVGHGLDGVPIIASIVDQPAALIGQGCVDRGDVKATFGTGCFVYANTGTQRTSAPAGTLATVAWRRGGETTYALDGGVLALGSAIQWAAGLGLPVDERALETPVAPDLACIPALVGLGAPHWDRVTRGAWFGMTASTTGAELVAALAEGLACRVVEVVRAIERDAGLTVETLRADGGLARSPALMQRVADLLGRPVAVAAEDEATVVGACAIAALRLGATTLDELRRRRTRARVAYAPAISVEQREARLAQFAHALALARQWR